MARAILLLKYGEVTPLGGWFASQLTKVAARSVEGFTADAVVPVPLHPSRLRERGYNQAELIAGPSRGFSVSHSGLSLSPHTARPDKVRLTRRERWETVRGAYAMHHRAKVDKLRVLLVDDVFTTGATLDACLPGSSWSRGRPGGGHDSCTSAAVLYGARSGYGESGPSRMNSFGHGGRTPRPKPLPERGARSARQVLCPPLLENQPSCKTRFWS